MRLKIETTPPEKEAVISVRMKGTDSVEIEINGAIVARIHKHPSRSGVTLDRQCLWQHEILGLVDIVDITSEGFIAEHTTS